MTIRKRMKVEQEGVLQLHDPELRAGAEVEVSVEVEPVREEKPLVEATREDEVRKPLWQRIVEIGAAVPREEWAKVPRDFSMQTDHYLYGGPRREE